MSLPRPATARTFASPVVEARGWLSGVTFPEDRPLIDAGQAAPSGPPPKALREVIARAALENPAAHRYGPDLGLPALREALAANICATYGGTVSAAQVAITSGANQAFCAAIASLAAPGDEVLLPSPWYFNHKMWLDMSGINTVPLPCDAHLMPDPEAAKARITPRTRAIVLVTPNNPTGAEYPAPLIATFRDLARTHGIALIIDETYRDFAASTGAPHSLFTDPDWDDTLIHLYSFSKSYRLTGHRVGAIATSAARLDEVEKFIDTVTICPSQLGQIAALWGLQNLGQWVASERAEVLTRQAAMRAAAPELASAGWRLLGLGGFFAWVEHPFPASSHDIAQALVTGASALTLPGTFFTPPESASPGLRLAFANLDAPRIATLASRLAHFSPNFSKL